MIYLYIKQHTVTGLKYFGMTRKKDPFKYTGSGTYWKRHINNHGIIDVKTINVFGFDDQEDATKFALRFSNDNNIVKSEEWANLREENALDGMPHGWIARNMSGINNPMYGNTHTDATKSKLSKMKIGEKNPMYGKNHTAHPMYGKTHTDATKEKMRKSSYNKLDSAVIQSRIDDIANSKYPQRGSLKILALMWNVSHTQARRFINQITA